MTKRDLIDLLKDYDDNEEVFIAFDYGDHGHSMVTQEIVEVIKHPVRKCAYGPMSQCIDMDEDVELKDTDPIIIMG